MENIDLSRLIYLLILGTAVAGWFIAENRKNLGQTARMALVWGLIFIGLIAGYGLWDDVRNDVAPRQSLASDGGSIILPRQADGHFHVTIDLNGVPVDFLVDTGASDIVLTREDARRIGVDPDELAFIGTANTANGSVRTARAFVASMELGPLRFERVRVSVNGGEMDRSLLGMAYLERIGRIEIENGEMRLTP